MENRVIRLDRITSRQQVLLVMDNWARRWERIDRAKKGKRSVWPQADLLILRLNYRLGRLQGLLWQIEAGEQITVFTNRLTRLRY